MNASPNQAFKKVDLKNLMTANLRPPQYVLKPLIPREQVTLMGGHGGSGKSLVGLTIACHVAAGQNWQPFEVNQGRVLIVSMEDTADILRYRMRNIIYAYGLNSKAIETSTTLLDCTKLEALVVEQSAKGRRMLATTKDANAILQMAQDYDLVLIDNASDAYAADENVRHLVRAFIKKLVSAVRPSDGAVLLLAHIDKAAAKSGGKGQNYSGSTAWHNSVRSRIALAQGKLRHEKHQFGLPHPDVGIEINSNGVPILIDDATLRLKEQQQLELDKSEVLRLLHEADAVGKSISTAKSGPNNIWKQITELPGFPSDWKSASNGRNRLTVAIQALESEGLICRESYTNEQRNKRERWILAISSVKREPTNSTDGQTTH